MSDTGEALGIGPMACPFVALELDRDRRSDKPDYRHRCFAEPTPQPRAISHQAAFCLSPNFAGCPIFQDWAVRASAQPVATAGGAAAGVTAAGATAGADVATTDLPPVPTDLPPVPTDLPPPLADITPELPAPGEAWPAEAFAPVDEPDASEQLSVFSAGTAEPASEATPQQAAAPPLAALPQPEPVRDFTSEPPVVPQPESDALVPDFLAGRPPRPARSSRPAELEPVTREDLIPSWERDGRFGAEPVERERTDRLGGVVTAITVVTILGLGVAGVIFLPGLLAGGGGGPSRTATLVPSAGPSDGAVIPTAIVTPLATVTPSPTPDVSAAPTPTPRTYTVKRGDSLSRIARKFDITVEELLAANPQIENPDHIQPGDVLTIPPPST
ncbi:MAG: LysM peptidoglycan-binding domain-containing protein [Chloroflexota bacterium]